MYDNDSMALTIHKHQKLTGSSLFLITWKLASDFQRSAGLSEGTISLEKYQLSCWYFQLFRYPGFI